MDRVGESANLAIRVGDHVRFIGSVECSQALRVGNREGMVFPAHLSSGGKLLLAGLPPAQLDSLYSDEKWAGRVDQRPALPALRRELATVRERGFALNREGTEAGVTAVGRGIAQDGAPVAAISVSLPTVRFTQGRLPELVAALAGEDDWGTPDELDAAFADTCDFVQQGLPFMWRDKWWRMYDRDPILTWVHGNVALLGDSAHPPLQYIAQGAIMAIEDGWVLAEQVARQRADDGSVDWAAALAAYEAVRPEHCRRVLTTSRTWGELWHLDGVAREQRNALLRSRDPYDYSFVDWLYGPTALEPEQEPELFVPTPLESAHQLAVAAD